MGGPNAGRYSPPVCFNENDAGEWHSDGVCGGMTMGMTVAADGNWSADGKCNTINGIS
jgi:hypothetical protein